MKRSRLFCVPFGRRHGVFDGHESYHAARAAAPHGTIGEAPRPDGSSVDCTYIPVRNGAACPSYFFVSYYIIHRHHVACPRALFYFYRRTAPLHILPNRIISPTSPSHRRSRRSIPSAPPHSLSSVLPLPHLASSTANLCAAHCPLPPFNDGPPPSPFRFLPPSPPRSPAPVPTMPPRPRPRPHLRAMHPHHALHASPSLSVPLHRPSLPRPPFHQPQLLILPVRPAAFHPVHLAGPLPLPRRAMSRRSPHPVCLRVPAHARARRSESASILRRCRRRACHHGTTCRPARRHACGLPSW